MSQGRDPLVKPFTSKCVSSEAVRVPGPVRERECSDDPPFPHHRTPAARSLQPPRTPLTHVPP